MNRSKTVCQLTRTIILATMVAGSILTISLPAYSHGGKTHADEAFTTFQAVQKAITLYDRLITSGKLPETWETGLASIKINTRTTKNQREYIVQFQRTAGDPDSVFFFFNHMGEYAGSNFTGQ